MILTSKSNPFIRETAALKDKKGRRESRLFLVEGAKMVRECMRSGLETEAVILAESYAGEEFPDAVRVSDELFRRLSDEKSPQGILCRVRIPKRALCPPDGSCLLLDGISDPGNLGAIIRTANAAGYRQIYLADCTDPYSPKSVRASMSGIFFVRLHIGGSEEIFRALERIPMLCADMDGENVFGFQPPEKFCLVIGNEANGVSEQVRKMCSHTVKIPMRESCESLNAGVSAGILMYVLAAAEHR